MMVNKIYIVIILGIISSNLIYPQVRASDQPEEYIGRMNNISLYAVQNIDGELGVEIRRDRKTFVKQNLPVQLELYFNESEITKVKTGYDSINRIYQGFTGYASYEINKGVVLTTIDKWRIRGDFIDLSRNVTVKGHAEGGFLSGFCLETSQPGSLNDLDYFIPGTLYGGPEYLSESAVAGNQVFRTGSIELAEDRLASPLFGMYFRDGSSLGLLKGNPDGRTTAEESADRENITIIDEGLKFGTFYLLDVTDGGVSVGYRYPATARVRQRSQRNTGDRNGISFEWRRRYHPIKDGVEHNYDLSFRVGQDERYMDFVTQNWRWAWNTLQPELSVHDIGLVRNSLIDMLSSQVVTVDDRTAIPFILNSITGEPDLDRYPESTNAILGFCGRSMEASNYFLIESDRESDEKRSRLLRSQALGIINSFLAIGMSPPEAEGFGIYDGELKNTRPKEDVMYLRSFTDDMKSLLAAYKREKEAGRPHPEWLEWCRDFADWLLPQQTFEGGFPRAWFFRDTEEGRKGEIAVESPTSSYNVVPFLVLLSEITDDPKYLNSAIRAAEFCWSEYHSKNNFIGGTIDNPNIVDKEAGTLSLEAYLILFESTGEQKWLQRARTSADFAETWMYIWNIPMPRDKTDPSLHWKEDVSTVGLQVISSRNPGGGDMYMTYEVDEYAKLYKYTGDEHYRDVAQILLHNTKGLLALPGRTYGMVGPGWQQEHWGISSPRRGYGGHRDWLPWVSTSHLNGILMLEEFDADLYKQLVEPPVPAEKSSEGAGKDSFFRSYRAKKDVHPSANPGSDFWKDIKGIEINKHIRTGMAPVQFHSEVRSRWTDENLYLLFIGPYETLDLREMPDTSKDTWKLWEHDVFEAYLGTDFKNINRYKELQISPQGEYLDLDIDASVERPGYGNERLWNSGMKTVAKIDEQNKIWYAEIVIPFSALEMNNPSVDDDIRCNIYRFLRDRDGQRNFLGWKTIPGGITHTPERFGLMKLVK